MQHQTVFLALQKATVLHLFLFLGEKRWALLFCFALLLWLISLIPAILPQTTCFGLLGLMSSVLFNSVLFKKAPLLLFSPLINHSLPLASLIKQFPKTGKIDLTSFFGGAVLLLIAPCNIFDISFTVYMCNQAGFWCPFLKCWIGIGVLERLIDLPVSE